MTKEQRVRFEMFLRVRDFGQAHRELFPESSTGGQAFAKVGDAAARIDAFATSKLLVVTDGHEELAVARAAIVDRMRIVARTARGTRKSDSAAGRRFRMPSRTSYVALLAAARSFISEAGECRAELDELGLPATCLPELRQAIDDLEAALTARRAGRAGTAAAHAGLKAAFADGTRAVRTLDIVVPNTVGSDAVLMAKWHRDRRVITGAAKVVPEDAAPDAGLQPEEVLRRAS